MDLLLVVYMMLMRIMYRYLSVLLRDMEKGDSLFLVIMVLTPWFPVEDIETIPLERHTTFRTTKTLFMPFPFQLSIRAGNSRFLNG
jgi:hypothetical protein